jgi:hypothetical protein
MRALARTDTPHKPTRIVDLVHGRLADETLAAAVARLPVTRLC